MAQPTNAQIAQAEAAFKQAVASQNAGDLQGAVTLYQRVIALMPGFAEGYANYGTALRGLRALPAARAAYDSALKLKPDHPGFLSNRGAILLDIGDAPGALADFDRALALAPDNARAHNNRGVVLVELKRDTEALVNFDRAIQLMPEFADAYGNRGNALRNLKRLSEAISSYDRALQLRPDARQLPGIRMLAKMEICDWRNRDAEAKALIDGARAGAAVSQVFTLLALTDDPALHKQAAEHWNRSEAPADPVLGPLFRYPGAASKIRVGYFSMDFQDHPVMSLAAETFERHDRSRFEITAFSLGPDADDPMRTRLKRAFDRFIDVKDKSNREVAEMARALQLDIAVDLAGMTTGARPGIFAMRAAPVQVGWLGYPGTMGAPYMDYIVADMVLVPLAAQTHYSEKVIYLPNFQPNDSKRAIDPATPSRAELGLPADGVVFACFNGAYKITPEVFDVWMRILTRVPGSVLWLSVGHEDARKNLRREAAVRGIAAERLVFAGHVAGAAQHLARLRAADLFLDTLPYNAHTTASDALWAGLPVLTRLGQSYAARVAASLLTSLDLMDLVTMTAEDFENRAVELANDPVQRAALRDKLARNRSSSLLFDSGRFTHSLESAYAQVVARHQAGHAPNHLFVGM
jgi:predicted O-linked N-acetylglucosamine transferase (SPINDLY family)